MGGELLEDLKSRIATRFRALWGETQSRSRAYCEAVADRVFTRLRTRYTSDAGSPTYTGSRVADTVTVADFRRLVRRWYAAARECIQEYCIHAAGGRALDVLVTHVETIVVPEFRAACRRRGDTDGGDATVIDWPLVDLTTNSLSKEVVDLHRRHITERDARVADRQRTIAQLGIFLSNEWVARASDGDLALLRAELDGDTISDWAARSTDTLLRLRAAGLDIPEALAKSEEGWAELVETAATRFRELASEARHSIASMEPQLAAATREARSAVAEQAHARRQRAESATGVVRLFQLLSSTAASGAAGYAAATAAGARRARRPGGGSDGSP